MPFPFDATLKDLVQEFTPDYLGALHQPSDGPLEVLNVDLSTVSAATDVAVAHGSPVQFVTDLNFQSGADSELPRRVFLYHSLLHYRHAVPVHSVIVLLRPAADSPELTGRLAYRLSGRRGSMTFRYQVVRLWEQSVRSLLQGGLGTLPLAPLCRMPGGRPLEDSFPSVLRHIDERLAGQPSEVARKLMAAALILTGLVLPRESAQALFRGTINMRESSVYQGILEEGRIAQARETLLHQGEIRFGRPARSTVDALESIADLDRLRALLARIVVVGSWSELLSDS